MAEQDFITSSSKKAFEIGYAIYRLSEYSSSRSISSFLEKEALRIFECAARGNFKQTAKEVSIADYVLRLGIEVGAIPPKAGNMLSSEMKTFQTAMLEQKRDDAGIASAVFNKTNALSSPDRKVQKEKVRVVKSVSKTEEQVNGNKRQTAIYEFIRQFGNCRLSDLQEKFPGVSERTLRYDLQKLAENEKIERVGGGGPFSFYRIPHAKGTPLERRGEEAPVENIGTEVIIEPGAKFP